MMDRMPTQADSTQAAVRTRWEYKIWSEGVRARFSDDRLERELNELGTEGWELCGTSGDARIFKRPR